MDSGFRRNDVGFAMVTSRVEGFRIILRVADYVLLPGVAQVGKGKLGAVSWLFWDRKSCWVVMMLIRG